MRELSVAVLGLTEGNGHPISAAITPGSTWNFQAWHRDFAAGVSHFTDAVGVTFQ